MGKRNQLFRNWMIENAYLVTIGCVLAMVVGCALYTQALRKEADVQAAAPAPEIQNRVTPIQTPELTPLPTIAPLHVRPVALVHSGGAWPLDGRVIRPYDAIKSVYWQSLNQWKAHCALDIAGKAGESVHASMDGIVNDAAYNALWGWQVRIAHDGLEMCYAGLESCTVQKGNTVRRGQVIGTLMEHIPCEAELETHLHLEMRKDGKLQDPEAVLAER